MCRLETGRMSPASPQVESGARARRALYWLFVVLLGIVGWGKLDVWLAPWFHFSVGGGASGAFRLLLAGYVVARVSARDVRLRGDWLLDPLVLLYLLAAVSPLWTWAEPEWPVRSHDTGDVLGVVLPGLTAYLVSRYLLDRDFETYGLGLLRALTVALSLVALQILVSAPSTLLDFSQVDSFYEHHTHVAMRMVMAIPLTIGLLMFDRRGGGEGTVRPAYVALLVLQIVGLTIANSRIGWIALGAVGAYGVAFGVSSKMRRWFAFALLMMLALAFTHPKVRANFLSVFNMRNEENYQRRLVIYSTDLKLIARHPLAGLGFSSRTFLYAGRALEGEWWEYDHPHDLFLQVVVYLGVPGFVLLVWVIVALGRAVVFLGRRAPPNYAPLVSAVRGALLGLVVMNVAETALSSERVAFMLPVLLAFVTSWARCFPSAVEGAVDAHAPGAGVGVDVDA